MKLITLPTFTQLSEALNKTTLKLHASQAHGLICGLLCGNAQQATSWEELITGGKCSTKTHNLLQELYDKTNKQLEEFLFELQLILPSDADELSVRAESLTLWCQGFLTGLKLSQVQLVGREPGEVTEAINDIIEIAKMNFEEVVSTEEDEAAYVELVEYVRMAAILIYQDVRETGTQKKPKRPSDHLH